MRWIMAKLRAPVNESYVGVALCFSLVMMTVLMGMIVWQASVISFQKDLIRLLWAGAQG